VGLNLIRELKAKLKIPLFVIGNINRSNINEVRSFGAERVAICRAILKAKNIPSQIQYFYDILH
jgi:thiamine monophosphate synthase